MPPIRTFIQLTAHLSSLGVRRKVAVVYPHDTNTQYAVLRALRENFASFFLITDADHHSHLAKLTESYQQYVTFYEVESGVAASQLAVQLVRQGEAEVIMKGLVHSADLFHAILNKEHGLLPAGHVLTHIAMAQIERYNKLLLFSDAAVIPRPNLEQYRAIIGYAASLAVRLGVERPKVALIHCNEEIHPNFAHTLIYQQLINEAQEGRLGDIVLGGPMDVRTACDAQSGAIKGIASPVVGDADVLIFPSIEAGNVFYKAISFFAHAEMAGVLMGATCAVAVSSRSDDDLTKYNSLSLACLANTQTIH